MRISKKNALFSVGVAAVGVLLTAPAANATRPPSLTIDPAQVRAGEAVAATVYCVGGVAPSGPVTSSGFAAPITVRGSSASDYSGQGKAAAKAGEYTATARCPGPSGTVVTARFTVTPGNPPTQPTKPSTPPSAKPSTKAQVPVVPSGGVETGGGGTAS